MHGGGFALPGQLQHDASQLLFSNASGVDLFGGPGTMGPMIMGGAAQGLAQPSFLSFGAAPSSGVLPRGEWNPSTSGMPEAKQDQGQQGMQPQDVSMQFASTGLTPPPNPWAGGSGALSPMLSNWETFPNGIPGGSDAGNAASGAPFGQPSAQVGAQPGAQPNNLSPEQQQLQLSWLMLQQQQQQQQLQQQQQPQQQQQSVLLGNGGMGALAPPIGGMTPPGIFPQGFYPDALVGFGSGMLQMPGAPAWPMGLPFGMPQPGAPAGAGPMSFGMPPTGPQQLSQQFGMPPMGSVMPYGMPQPTPPQGMQFPSLQPGAGAGGMPLAMPQLMPGQPFDMTSQLPNLMLPQAPGTVPPPLMFPPPAGMEVPQATGLPQLPRMPVAPSSVSDGHPPPASGGHAPKATHASHGGGTHDKHHADEARKAKRQQCNRESARRSLLMKNQRLKDMTGEVDELEQRNVQLQGQMEQLLRSAENLKCHNQVLNEGIKHMQVLRSPPPEELRDREQAIAGAIVAAMGGLEDAMRADLDVVIVKREEAGHGGDTDGSDDEGYSSEPEAATADGSSKGGSGTSPRGVLQPPCKVMALSQTPSTGQAAGGPQVAAPAAAAAAATAAAPTAAATAVAAPIAAAAAVTAAAPGAKAQHPLLAAAAAAAASKSMDPRLMERALGVDPACWQKAASAFASHLALMAQTVQQQKVRPGPDSSGSAGAYPAAASSGSAPALPAAAAAGAGAADGMYEASASAMPGFALIQRAGAAGGSVYVVNQVAGDGASAAVPDADASAPPPPQQRGTQGGALGSPMTSHLLHVESAGPRPTSSAEAVGSPAQPHGGQAVRQGDVAEPTGLFVDGRQSVRQGDVMQPGGLVAAPKGLLMDGRQVSGTPPSKEKGQGEFGLRNLDGEQQVGEHGSESVVAAPPAWA